MPTDRLESGTHRRGSPAAAGAYCIRPPRPPACRHVAVGRVGNGATAGRLLRRTGAERGCWRLNGRMRYAPTCAGRVAPDTAISYRNNLARAGEMPCVRARNDRRCGWLLGLCARQSQSAHQATPWPRPHSRIQQRQYLTNQTLQLAELVPAGDPHRHFVKAHVLEHAQMLGALLRRPGRRP